MDTSLLGFAKRHAEETVRILLSQFWGALHQQPSKLKAFVDYARAYSHKRTSQ